MSEQTIRAKSNVTGGITKTDKIPKELRARAELLRVIKKQSTFDLVYYAVFIALGFLCIGLFHKDWMIYLTVAELFCALIVNNLLARGRVLGIWMNIVDCCLFAVICFITKAYGELFKTFVISNAFNIYGIISWSRQGKPKKGEQEVKAPKNDELEVRTMSKKLWIIILSGFAVGCVASYFALEALGTTLAYLGCITFTCNIVIKYLQMSRYKESYWFALFSSMISTSMWTVMLVQAVISGNDWSILPTLGGALSGFSSNIYGLITWNKLYNRTILNGGAYLAMRPVQIKKIVKIKRKSNMYAHLSWLPEKDHIPTAEELAMQKRIAIAVRQGLFQ